MSYKLVEDLQKKAITISQACGALQVSRSGYYAHQAPKNTRLEDASRSPK